MIHTQDADFTLLNCDVLEGLRSLPDGSVHCVVCSPPYWGLRDYGTGAWEGGDETCDHLQKVGGTAASTLGEASGGHAMSDEARVRATTRSFVPYSDVCGKCGARRVDNQLGLEPTPDLYVQRMVEVFREVRRVLRSDGTCWLNLGDSYASSPPGNKGTPDEAYKSSGLAGARTGSRYMQTLASSVGTKRNTIVGNLKPKDLVGIPWRVAFALQADGWWLRSDIIWSKPNPMPESVTDRPTKAHEYVFLLTKSARYFFDQEAVREAYEGDPEYRYGRVGAYQDRAINGVGDGTTPTRIVGPDGRRKTTVTGRDGSLQHRDGERWPNVGRNVRSVWEIATQPYPEAHFATYPEELVRRCVLAGTSERGCCPECGAPWEREVERESTVTVERGSVPSSFRANLDGPQQAGIYTTTLTLGWRSTCSCRSFFERDVNGELNKPHAPIPCTVLDPFLGSGTTAHVARKHGRRSIGIELNPDYCQLAARRMQQQSLFAVT